MAAAIDDIRFGLRRALWKIRQGRVRAMGAEGLPADVLSILNDLTTELDKKADPGTNS
ncbi:hypothetical protein PV963_42975 [Streptomyces coeruleorubidus]|uniref:hypothetical protein n=1 Tax=Streptomyces coeruleorubidus TaxID=116188 RepID=UPI00237F821F|nr:hypothetical protein [Streptomyces coeruleorubidus]WDV56610.1 hypothetical protein PV963_42975 [Streptomyces coeruleorubidus]